MGNQNQNQNQNNQNNYSAPNNSNINNENQNTITGANNNINSISSENENPNRIIEESSNNEQSQNNQNSENPENIGGDNPAPPNPNGENTNSDCPVPADLSTYEKHFSFNGLMTKIKETAKKAGLKAIYMALLLYYALESPTISVMDKAIIYGALGYFISPIDIVPDILPLIGLSDDIAVLAWAFSRVKHNITDMTREKAKTKLKIWFGNFDEKEIDDL
jgi:uncharacterized membrane protein YkvA (DUF1232 family)